MLRFVFNERKATQAAAHIIKFYKGTLSYLKLIKLLYLADRKALIETGSPITGDKMVAMPKGPVLSMVYDLITWGERESGYWREYISEPTHYNVSLVKDNPENDELSKYELGILDDINEKLGHLDKWQLVDLTHELPEWEDPKGSSYPIPPEKILQVENIPSDEIRRITEESEELWFLDSCKPSGPF